jgi:hypothetical protein
MVRQKAQYLEQCFSVCEKKNKYGLKGFTPSGPNPTDTKFKEIPNMWHGQEEGACLERVCCGRYRTFDMLWSDNDGAGALKMNRPFACSCLFCCCRCNHQHMDVRDAEGSILGHIEDEYKCWDYFCIPGGTWYYNVFNVAGDRRFRLRVQDPTCCNGCRNCCAPTCFNRTYNIDIFEGGDDSVVTGKLDFVWPGWKCPRLLTDASNIVLQFPPATSDNPDDKALLVGAMLLIEYMHFEKGAQD